MLRPVGAMQGVDLLRTDRVASPVWRSVRMLALLVCCVAALLSVGVASAFAEASISHRPEGIKEYEKIADNWSGNVEREPEYNEPPGYYLEEVGTSGDGTYEYTEECEEGNIFEGMCWPAHRHRPEFGRDTSQRLC